MKNFFKILILLLAIGSTTVDAQTASDSTSLPAAVEEPPQRTPVTEIMIRAVQREDGTIEYIFPRSVALDYRNLLRAIPEIQELFKAEQEKAALYEEEVANLTAEISIWEDRVDARDIEINLRKEENAQQEVVINELRRDLRRQKFTTIAVGTGIAVLVTALSLLLAH